MSPHSAALVASMVSPVNLERSLSADCPRESDHGCGAEQADPYTGSRKRSATGSDGQITGCDKLTTRCGRDSLNLGNDWLGNRLKLCHQLCTYREHHPVVVR